MDGKILHHETIEPFCLGVHIYQQSNIGYLCQTGRLKSEIN